MLVVPDVGAVALLNRLLHTALAVGGDLSLRLFRNDYTPDAASVTTDFTEAVFSGYYRQTITAAGWDGAAMDGDAAQIVYPSGSISWNCHEDGTTVFGYYVVDPATEVLLWAERFATPQALDDGSSLGLELRFRGQSLVS